MIDVLISGAGIAGTATAYWLARHGLTPTVVERAPEIRAAGYKVDLRGAAVEVVSRMGVLDTLRRMNTDMQVSTFYGDDGRVRAVMDARLFGGRSLGDLEVLRGELNQLLYDLTSSRVEYVFDDSVTSIDRDGHVQFESGADRKFDLIVGADGLHSRTREVVFGEEALFAKDLGYRFAIATVPDHLGLDREEAVYLSPRRTVNVYRTPGTENAKVLFLWSRSAGDDNQIGEGGPGELLRVAMAGAGWETARLVEEAVESEDLYVDTLTQIQMDQWSQGRVGLVGDAAYCATLASGQGTSLALVGAYVLAGEIAARQGFGDFSDGLLRYEQQMRPFVEANQKLAVRNIRGMVMNSRTTAWFQLGMLRLLPHLPGRESMIERVAAPIAQAANAINLLDYSRRPWQPVEAEERSK